MAITQRSDIANTIETRVSEIVTETLVQESVMLPNVMDRTAEVGPGMNQLDIPLLNKLALNTVTPDGADVTPQTITTGVAQLQLTTHKSYDFSIPDAVAIESKLNLVQEQVAIGARVHAADVDDAILAALVAGVSTATPDHLIALDASDALVDLRSAKKLLDDADVPKMDRFFVASPGFMQKLFSANNIIRANEYGNAGGIQGAVIASVFGFNILESSSDEIPEDGFVAYHRMTANFARHITPKFERQRQVLGHRDDYSLSQKYGVVNADPAGIRIVVGSSTGS